MSHHRHPTSAEERAPKLGPWCLYLAATEGHSARVEATEFDAGHMQLRRARLDGEGAQVWNHWCVPKDQFFVCYRAEPDQVVSSTTDFSTAHAKAWAKGHGG